MRATSLSALALLILTLGCENAGGVLTGEDRTSAGDDDSVAGDDDTSAGDDDSVGDDDDSVGDDDDDDGSPWEGEWPVDAALYVQWGDDGKGPGGGGGDDPFCEAELVLIVDEAGEFEAEGLCTREGDGGGPGGGGPELTLRFEGEVADNGEAEGDVAVITEWGDESTMELEGRFGDPEDDMVWLTWTGEMELGWDEQDVIGEAYTD